MTAPPDPSVVDARTAVAGHALSPKKLLLSKWTAVSPAGKEKHFVVTRVVEPEPPSARVEWVEIEAVHSRRSTVLRWRDLKDVDRWQRGWV